MIRGDGINPIGKVIVRNLPPIVQIAYTLGDMEKQWIRVAGPQLADRTRPTCFDRRELVVACDTPDAAQLVRMSAGSMLMRIKRLFGLEIPMIRTVVARGQKRRPAPVEGKKRKIDVPQEWIDEAYEEMKKTISDEEVAMSLAKLQATVRARESLKERRGSK